MQHKIQIVLHHTVSGTAASAIDWWKIRIDGKGTIATPYVIDRDGTIYQLFSPFQWASHLGVLGMSNLDRQSIGIEMVSWGGLKPEDIGTKVPEKEVVSYEKPYRGFTHFHSYSDAQLESVSLLLPILSVAAQVPLAYNYDNLFTYSPNTALKNKKGLYSHAAFRKDKSDCHPQPEFIYMLRSLV